MWKQLGVQAELVNREVKVHYDELKQSNFDVARAAWVSDYNDPQNFLYLLETRTGVQNYGRYSNPEFDALMVAQGQERDPKARLDIMKQAERIAMSEDAWLPIYYYVSKRLVSQKVSGFVDNAEKGPSLALGFARGIGAGGVTPDPASAGHRAADAPDHHHAQLLHDAAGARRAVRQERPIPPEIMRNIEKAYHLDEPLVQQYLRYLGGLLRAISARPTGPRISPSASCFWRAPPPASRSGVWPCCWRRLWACSPASSRPCARTVGPTIR